MKEKDLLKAMTNIDDEFIAQPKEEKEKKLAKKFKPIYAIASACAVFAVCLIVGVSGMGMAKSAAPMEAADMEYEYVARDEEFFAGAMNVSEAEEAPKKEMAASKAANGVFEPYYGEVKDTPQLMTDPVAANGSAQATRTQKLVYTANLLLQTEDFDKTLEDLKKLVEFMGGYFESSDVYNGSIYGQNTKNGYYQIRIPSDKYKNFVSSVGESWHLASINEYVDDIAKQYYETADRLETLRIKEDRLHELLAKADNMSDILTIENQLTNTEYEIQSYQNTLNNYDDQVDYSRVSIEIDEVRQFDGSANQRESFGKRFVRALKNGARGFVSGIQDIIIAFGYHIIEIGIIAVVIIVLWKLHIIRRIIQYFKKEQ